MSMTSEIGSKIKEIRNRYELSQTRFGKKVGLSGKTISSYETGRSTPPLKVLEDITSVYNVSLIVVKEEKRDSFMSKIDSLRMILNELEEGLN